MSIELNQSRRKVLGISEQVRFSETVGSAAEQVGADYVFFQSLREAQSALERDPQCCIVIDNTTAQVFDSCDLSLVSLGTLASIVVVPANDFDAKFHAACIGASYVLTAPVGVGELVVKLTSIFSGQFRLGAMVSANRQNLTHQYLSLSQRQVQILPLVMKGETNKAIAGNLNLGLRMVEQERAAMIRHFQVNSLAELIQVVAIAIDEMN